MAKIRPIYVVFIFVLCIKFNPINGDGFIQQKFDISDGEAGDELNCNNECYNRVQQNTQVQVETYSGKI